MKQREIESPRPGLSVHLALLFVQLCFGGFHVAAKSTVALMHPLALACLRVALATPLLLGNAVWFDRRLLPPRRYMPHLALIGLLGVTINQLLYLVGVRMTTATNAAILIPSIPAFAVLVALVLRVESVSRARLLGVGLSMAGALLLLRPQQLTVAGQGDTALGNLLVLLNCLSYSGFLVLQRPLHRYLPWRMVIAWAFVFGSLAVWAVGYRHVLELDLLAVPLEAWLGLIYIVVFPTTMAYALNTWAVRRSSPVLVAAYTTLQPLVASALAWVLLGESIGWVELSSFSLLVAGLWQVSRT